MIGLGPNELVPASHRLTSVASVPRAVLAASLDDEAQPPCRSAPMDAASVAAALPPPLVIAPRPRVEWTTREVTVVREHYPTGGVPACAPILPRRSYTAIHQMASKLGLLKTDRRKFTRWTTDEHIDAAIRRTYIENPAKGAIDALAITLMRPRCWVSARARKLGLVQPRFKELPWTQVELDLIADNATKNNQTIARLLKRRGFNRTPTAIVVKLKRLHADRTDLDHYTGRGLADLMGVDSKTVTGWIHKGWLVAKRRGTDRVETQGGDQHWIHRRAVRRFITENTGAVDIRKVDKFWFIDLLTDKTAAPLFARTEAGDAA